MEAIAERSISKWWLRGLAVLLTASPPALLLWFQDALRPLLSAAAPEVVLRILAGLLLTTLALLAFILLERPWLKWDEPTGTWVNRLDDYRYCGICRAKKLFSPLKNEVTGWRCVICGTFRSDPARKAKESPRGSVPGAALVDGAMRLNMPTDTDPQQQEAASPLVFVARSFLR